MNLGSSQAATGAESSYPPNNVPSAVSTQSNMVKINCSISEFEKRGERNILREQSKFCTVERKTMFLTEKEQKVEQK